jgi:hypothetical protein
MLIAIFRGSQMYVSENRVKNKKNDPVTQQTVSYTLRVGPRFDPAVFLVLSLPDLGTSIPSKKKEIGTSIQ